MRKAQGNFFKLNSPSFYLLGLLFLFAFGLFVLLAHEVVMEKEDWFDMKVFTFLKSFSSPLLIQFFKAITFFGSSSFLFPAWLILIGLLFFTHRKKEALDIAALAITSTLLMYGLKALFARHRPELPLFHELTTYSFPSGHSLSSLVFCSAIIWLVWQSAWQAKWKWLLSVLLLAFSVAIGISRVVLRYHYASDVVGGFSLGMAYILLFFALRTRLRNAGN
ncbi:MAG: phosphatase family protein [Flavisolibacter sp.]|jgi:undecaprenyl-diphosphatase|nr:phosphatase family protein [Flavisolibacter sp.]